MPEWPNGVASRATGLVPTQVRILFPAIKMLNLERKFVNTIGVTGLSLLISLSTLNIDSIAQEANEMPKSEIRYSYMIARLAYNEFIYRVKEGSLTKEKEIELMILINEGYIRALIDIKGSRYEAVLWNELGGIMRKLGHHDKAELYFQKALELNREFGNGN